MSHQCWQCGASSNIDPKDDVALRMFCTPADHGWVAWRYAVNAGRYDVHSDGALDINIKYADSFDTIAEAKRVARDLTGYDYINIIKIRGA